MACPYLPLFEIFASEFIALLSIEETGTDHVFECLLYVVCSLPPQEYPAFAFNVVCTHLSLRRYRQSAWRPARSSEGEKIAKFGFTNYQSLIKDHPALVVFRQRQLLYQDHQIHQSLPLTVRSPPPHIRRASDLPKSFQTSQ